MKTYELGLYEKALPSELGWREKLTEAKIAGYDYLELSIDETDEKLSRLTMSDQEAGLLLKIMEETGISVRTMCLSGHRKYPMGSRDASIRQRSMEIMSQAIELAGRLGIRMIQLAGYDVYYEESTPETAAYFEENLHRACEMAATGGVLLGFETMENEFMNTTEKAMHYVARMKSPYLGIYPDCGNLTNAALEYHSDVVADLRKGEGHLLAMHLKETLPGKFREIPFGTGHVDFETVIQAAWELGVRRYVTEFWYTGNPGWKQDLVQAKTLMRSYLDKQ